MKSIVVVDDLQTGDIKPAELIGQYIGMLRADLRTFFLETGELREANCPACASSVRRGGFERYGLQYRECADCGTLYVSPRPSDEAIVRFYREAPSRSFWSQKLSEATRQKRSEKIIKPRIEWVADSYAEHCPRAKRWIDLHASQMRYVEAMAGTKNSLQKIVVSPYFDGNVETPTGVVLDAAGWRTFSQTDADIVTVFELLDQTSDADGLMGRVNGALKRGGLCFITVILASGFDVKTLGARAENIYPPDRMNVFSVKGLKTLLEKSGFELLEFSTPGVLDVDIVENALKADPDIEVSPFIRDLVLNQSDEVRGAFQAFLQANLLSSYGRVLIRKK